MEVIGCILLVIILQVGIGLLVHDWKRDETFEEQGLNPYAGNGYQTDKYGKEWFIYGQS